MRYAYFDLDGVCLVISTDAIDEHTYPYEKLVPDDGKPSDYWYDSVKDRISSTQPVIDLLKMIGAKPVLKIEEIYTFNIPDNCVLEIDGTRYKNQVTMKFDIPRKIIFFLKGLWVGDVTADVNSYIEDRLTAYPSVEDQLDMLYNLGFDAWKAEISRIKDKFPKPE